jgi:hypothetical protein
MSIYICYKYSNVCIYTNMYMCLHRAVKGCHIYALLISRHLNDNDDDNNNDDNDWW